MAIATVVCIAAPAAAQDSCSDLGLSSNSLADRRTYIQTPFGWRVFSRISDLPIARRGIVKIAYVIKLPPDQNRSGVVVVKTGRSPAAPSYLNRKLKLVRKSSMQDGSCKKPGAFGKFGQARIPATDYDRYHDFGEINLEKGTLGTLDDFHVAYGKDCRRTNEHRAGLFRSVTNRASFSYSEDIVDKGAPRAFDRAVAKLNVISPAVARTLLEPYGDRRTEIKQYRTSEGLACVEIAVPVSGRGGFLRINDLGAPVIKGKREIRY